MSAANPSSARPRRRGKKALPMVALLLLAAGVWGGVTYWRWHQDWTRTVSRAQGGLPPSGGKYFFKRLEIPVPQFRQSDPRWGRDRLGPSTTDTLSSAGCAVSSAAMVLASYGVDTDPQRLNDYCTANGGFTPEAWLMWEVPATLSNEKVRFVYEDDPSYRLIDENLKRGNPVIVRIRYTSGITHFVVVCGKDGYDYLIRDPGGKANRGVYPLKEFGSNIEALRYYRKT